MLNKKYALNNEMSLTTNYYSTTAHLIKVCSDVMVELSLELPVRVVWRIPMTYSAANCQDQARAIIAVRDFWS